MIVTNDLKRLTTKALTLPSTREGSGLDIAFERSLLRIPDKAQRLRP
jgi:hypothetical protein